MSAAASEGRSQAGPTSRSRSKGRELALKYLYQADVRPDDAEPFATFAERENEGTAATLFAQSLVEGVLARRTEIDALISGLATNWSVRRMAILDRNIIRIGAFEILSDSPPPRSVVINEAIELGKRFSTAESGKFINGILDKIGRAGLPGSDPVAPATEDE